MSYFNYAPKGEKIDVIIPRQWYHSFSMKDEKKNPLRTVDLQKTNIFISSCYYFHSYSNGKKQITASNKTLSSGRRKKNKLSSHRHLSRWQPNFNKLNSATQYLCMSLERYYFQSWFWWIKIPDINKRNHVVNSILEVRENQDNSEKFQKGPQFHRDRS